jgi:hypothetical protein
MERQVKLASEQARRNSEEAFSPATSPERVAELAVAFDGDFARAGELLDQAFDADADPNGMSQLAEHLLQAVQDLDAIGVTRDALDFRTTRSV